MKIRNGFVSNSSSSSFVVSLDKLSGRDLARLLDYPSNNESYSDYWNISVNLNANILRGSTAMDNGNLSEFCQAYNITCDGFEWESY